MPEANGVIPEHLMLSRLEQSEQLRDFFVAMWQQNPGLAQAAGPTIQRWLSEHVPQSSVRPD